MKALVPWQPSPAEKEDLRRRLLASDAVVPFSADPDLLTRVAALGMQQEVGTQNDELARFVFDADSDAVVARASLRAELVTYGNEVGVRIWAEGHPRITLRFPGIRALLHPRHCFDADGHLRQLVVFPSVVARWLGTQGVEAVLVKAWALNTVFGGFAPSDGYYQTNMWELSNIDVLQYARLVERRQIAFLGTHDLVAHISGTRGEAWTELAKTATRVRQCIEGYLAGVPDPNLSALILPYVAGIFLDDLAQPPCYGAPSRLAGLDAVLRAIESRALPPGELRYQLRFPESYERLVTLVRFGSDRDVEQQAPGLVAALVAEIHQTSARF